MSATERRRVPLVLVASGDAATADEVARRLRRDGATAYAVHSVEGCLRVATAVGPDIVLLDPRLPRRLETLLRAHPRSAHAELVHLSADTVREAGVTAESGIWLSPAAA